MDNQALVTVNHTLNEPQTPPVLTWTREQVDLIKRTVAKGATDDELALFVHTCQRTGLDPIARQIYAIKRGGQMTIQTGIDGYRLIAARTGNHAGTDDAIFDTEDGKHPGKATTTVYRFVKGQRVAFTASARWSEYNQGNQMWERFAYVMLAKCSEALALRKAFPAELSGVYTHEEMMQADRVAPPQGGQSALTSRQDQDEEQIDQRTITEPQQKRLFALLKEHKIENAHFKAWLEAVVSLSSTKDITRGDYEPICEAITSGEIANWKPSGEGDGQ